MTELKLEKTIGARGAEKWPGDIPLWNLYTAGVGGQRFLEGLKAGKILGSSDGQGGPTFVPGRLFDERTLAELTEWKEVGPEAELVSWTTVPCDAEGKPLAQSTTVGFIRFAGCEGGMIHRLRDVDADQLQAGLKLRPQFADPALRTGSVNDIVAFVPSS